MVLLDISPLIWRRLLVRSDSTITDPHHILHIIVGWTDTHFHQFHIQGKQYGRARITRISGMGFRNNPTRIRLADRGLRLRERFLVLIFQELRTRD